MESLLVDVEKTESNKHNFKTTTDNESLTNFCLVCGSQKIYYDFSIDKFRVEECVDCGLMRLNPQPNNQALDLIYSKDHSIHPDNNLSPIRQLKSMDADDYLRLVELYTKAPLCGRLLEIGCKQGDFLMKAAEKGLQVTGVEYSPYAASIAANQLGHCGAMIYGDCRQLIALNQKFDYIIFSGVLDYVCHPKKLLQDVHTLLPENGVAICIVPSLDSFSARLMKNKWMEFKPEHLWYFSTATLKRLFYSAGFYKTKVNKIKKTLSFDYVTKYFERHPTSLITHLTQVLSRMLPASLKQYPFRITSGSIMLLARRNTIRLPKTVSVVMAAFNESKTIQKIIENVLNKTIFNNEIRIELVIVESHSTDGTQDIIRRYETHERVKVIWQDKPLGKGNAIRAGLKHITGEYVLIQDADDEYDIEDYESLIGPLITGEADFVLGARHGGRTFKMRKFDNQRLTGFILNMGHWVFTFLINILFSLRLKDPFTMYKVFRADCLDGLTFVCDRFDFDYELLIKLVKNGHRPIEIPVNYRSRSFKEGKKVRIFRDPWTWLMVLIKLKFQRND